MTSTEKKWNDTTPDQAEEVARALEKLAATVRQHAPSSVAIDFARRHVEMPSTEGGFRQFGDGGLERVAIEIRW